jgi:hypothetical protein
MSLSNQTGRPIGIPPIIVPDNISAWSQFNRAPYTFNHSLADHPLFDIERLLSLAKSVLDRGDPLNCWLAIEGDEKFNGSPPQDKLLEAIRDIEKGRIWFKISNIDRLDPEYRELLHRTIDEIEDITGLPLRNDVRFSLMTAFITSPNMETPYHFDHDTNFLFQIRGEKHVRIFDPQDRSVLTENEIERFYGGDTLAGIYREEVLKLGKLHQLAPGTAVHHPPLAPHIVTTTDSVSVSVSMSFILSRELYNARIYQANYCLRRLGFQPLPPGRSRFKDKLKYRTFEMLAKPNPESWDEVLYSGINRLRSPLRLARRMMQMPHRA